MLTRISVFVVASFSCFIVVQSKEWAATNFSFESALELKQLLFQNYSKDFRPIPNQRKQIEIYVYWDLRSINAFHEVTGDLITSSTFTTIWKNEMLKWNMSIYSTPYVILKSADIWNPALALDNPTGSANIRKEYEQGTIRCTSNGFSYFTVSVRTSTVCQPDMTFYPLDRHNCTIIVSSPDYFIEEMLIFPLVGTNTSTSVVASQWDVSSLYTYNDDTAQHSRAVFGIVFQRKPEFIIMNLLTPIALLCFLNLAVFLLPPQSGERISFSVTIFLSFSVYMTLISEKLPVTNPVSTFTKYLVCNAMYSASILFSTLVGLRFHMAEEEVVMIPLCVSKFMRLCCCRYSSCVKSQYKMKHELTDTGHDSSVNNEDININSNADSLFHVLPSNNIDSNNDKGVCISTAMLKTDIGKLIDKFCLVIFFLILLSGNAVFVLYISLS